MKATTTKQQKKIIFEIFCAFFLVGSGGIFLTAVILMLLVRLQYSHRVFEVCSIFFFAIF